MLLAELLGFKVHLYADDTQLYGFSVDRIHGTAIDAIGHWMSANLLSLNADKTQVLCLGIPGSKLTG